MSLEQEIRRANQNIFEIESKLKQLVMDSTDVTFSLIDPTTGNSMPITHESLPKIKANFESWKQGFQGTLSEVFTYPELFVVVSPTGGGDGSSADSSTTLDVALEEIPKISKYVYCSIVLLDGTYDYPNLNIKIPHLTNYIRFRKSDFAAGTPILNLGSVEVWGAARFSLVQVHAILNGTTAEGAISIRDNASLYLDNATVESTSATNTISVYNGGSAHVNNSVINNNSVANGVGIHISRGELKANTVEIQNASTGLQALAGARIWRENFTYTNVTTHENVDVYSVVQP